MDPMVGSAVSNNGVIIISDSSDNADLLDFCFLCSRQFFHENLDDYGTERIKDEDILETFFEELGPVDRALLQCCPTCKVLCKTLIRTKEALASLIDEITSLLLRSRKVSYLLSKSRVVSRLFQSSNSSLPPCEASYSYLQQPLSQMNFTKDTSNNTQNNSNHSFAAQFDLRLDTSNLSVTDSLYLGLTQSISTSVIKKSPPKSKLGKSGIEIPTSCCSTSFSSILNESIMNSVSDNACDASENVIISCSSSSSLNKSTSESIRDRRVTGVKEQKNPKATKVNGHTPVITRIISEANTPDTKEVTNFSSLQCSPEPTNQSSNNTDSQSAAVCDDTQTSSKNIKAHIRNTDGGGAHNQHEVSSQLPRGVNSILHTKDKDKFSFDNSSKCSDSSDTDSTACKKREKKKLSKYKCSLCNKHFQSSTTLKNHLSAHNHERKYICEICGISYRHKVGLEAHVAIHNGEPKFQCEICQKTFTQKSGLQRHTRIHTGKHQFQCDICGKQFLHHTSFSAHKLMHEGVKNYACGHCSLTFSIKSHLQRHFKVHTGEKPHKCDLCERSFAEKYNLQVHLKSHENTLTSSHKCPKCSKGFTRKFKLKQHLNKVHGS